MFQDRLPAALFALHFFLLLPGFAVAQFDKANNLYQDKRYAAAAAQYESALREKDNLPAKARLAYCYRMLNQTDRAEALYAEVVQHEKARSDAYFNYAEALMSNGKYAEAKTWFQKYAVLEPDDSTARHRAAACDRVGQFQPYFPGLQIEAYDFNSEADDNTPVFWHGGLVFTSDRPSGKGLLKEKSGWTGRDYLKLYFSGFDPEKGLFSEPRSLSGKLNELNKNTANASFTGDWNQIFFSRNGVVANAKGEYTLQLYTAERSGNRWKNEHKLDFCRPELNYMHPAVSPDGNTLFYATNAGGEGGFDIFMAQKNRDGDWGRARNLGPHINTPAHEAFPYFHRDGRLFFCSKGHAGFGGFDLFVARFDTAAGQWQAPVNLGRPLNSSLDDLGFCLAPNDSVGVFTSGRDGGDDDVYLFWLGESKRLRQVLFPKTGAVAGAKEEVGEGLPEAKTETAAAAQMPVGQPVAIEKVPDVSTEPKLVPGENPPAQNAPPSERPAAATPTLPPVLVEKTPAENLPVAEKTPPVSPGENLSPGEKISPKMDSAVVQKTENQAIAQNSPPLETPPAPAMHSIAPPKSPGVLSEPKTPKPETPKSPIHPFFDELKTTGAHEGATFPLPGLRHADELATDLPPDAAPEIEALVSLFGQYPGLALEIACHTENIGFTDRHQAVSEARAGAIRQAILEKGIAPERVAARGYGGRSPRNECRIGIGCPPEKHLENRRTEMRILRFD